MESSENFGLRFGEIGSVYNAVGRELPDNYLLRNLLPPQHSGSNDPRVIPDVPNESWMEISSKLSAREKRNMSMAIKSAIYAGIETVGKVREIRETLHRKVSINQSQALIEAFKVTE